MIDSRIIIIDDNDDIHLDYRKILLSTKDEKEKELEEFERILFGDSSQVKPWTKDINFNIDSVYQGEEGYRRIVDAENEGKPYSVAFMDVRMPPGIDGVEATQKVLAESNLTQIVLCSAYSDYPWDEIVEKLGISDRVLFLEKPFQAIEVQQLALSLSAKFDNMFKLKRRALELLEKREQAEAAGRAKDAFIANVSHEIRTPLTSIMGYAEKITLASEVQNEVRQDATVIFRNSKHLLSMVNDLLDISKIESGFLEYEITDISPFELLTDVENTLEIKAKEKNLQFNIDYEYPLVPSFKSDRTRLKQVLINIIGNAIKFTEKGSISVKVASDIERQKISFVVSDTGIGISKENLNSIFKPFTQSDVSITRKYGGTGLGLNVSKKIMDGMKGTIGLVSEIGKGSEFTISLPLSDLGETISYAYDSNVFSGTVSEPERLGPLEPSFRGKVLLAEDSEDSRNIISYYLEMAGLEVSHAENGQVCLEMVEKEQFDMIILDMQMPVMDGITAAKILRENSFDGRIIALSANRLEGQIKQCLEAGCDAFISKPFQKKALFDALQEYF